MIGYFFSIAFSEYRKMSFHPLEPQRGGMSIENRGPQSLEPQRGDMCKTFPLTGPFHSVNVILKSTIDGSAGC